MKKKLLISTLSLLLFALPLWAIVSGRSLSVTLKDLCNELHEAFQKRSATQLRFDEDYERQHQRMVDVISKSNELSILLYTQEQEMTFHMAFALKKVTDEYSHFRRERRPYDYLVSSLNYEIDRYARLIEALRRLPPMKKEIEVEIVPDSLLYRNDSIDLHMLDSISSLEKEIIRIAAKDTVQTPFVLDSAGQAFRDSCIYLASELLKMHADNRQKVIADSTHYQEAYWRIQEAYDYAAARYRDLEQYVFIDGQTPFLSILASPRYYWNKVKVDLSKQYDFGEIFYEEGQYTDEKGNPRTPNFYVDISSRGENALMVLGCCIELVLLVFSWLFALLTNWLLCRYTRLKRFISKKKLPLFSILTGTILYFLVVGYGMKGDDIFQMGVKHINTFLWLLIAISGSLLLRVKPDQFRPCLQIYLPTILITLVIIACRITFVPDKLMNMLFPPVLALIVLRQLFYCTRVSGKAASVDSTMGWVSLVIYIIAFGVAFIGYTFVALLILVCWYFLLALWLTILCISDILIRYKERWLDKRIDAMRLRITYVGGEDRESLLFGASWFYDVIRVVVIPAMVLLSLPLCIRSSLNIFDFDDLYVKFYENPFIQLMDNDGYETLRVSGRSIIYLLILFYVLRYLNRAIHTIWQYARYTTFMRKHNRSSIRPNEINLSLGNSVISVLIWFFYAVVVISVWKIPTGSLGLVAGGLSAGIGLALKDVINNFIYGIQLMGGRLRVGDWIECDGVRGKVTAINYQCVQAETVEGTEMSFLNSSLFGKNFNNLTRNNSYELTVITVGVAYGTNIQHVRQVLVEGMQRMRTKDHYGREIVDPKRGIYVVVGNMSDNAVDINVKQYVLVAERIGYVDRAKEVIYESLNAAGITIAFPQCDVHLIPPRPL